MDPKTLNPHLLHVNHQGYCSHFGTESFFARYTRWHEMDIITMGGGENVIDGVRYTLQSGDVFYRTDGMHSQHFNPYHCFFFVFDPVYDPCRAETYGQDYLGEFNEQKSEDWHPIPPFDFAKGPRLGRLTDIEPVYQLADRINYEMTRNPRDELLIKSLFGQLLCELRNQLTARPIQERKAFQYPQYHNRIEDLCYYIQNNSQKTLSIDEMAHITRLSPNFFSRVFKDSVGITPMEFVWKVRVNHIKTLLLDTELQIAQIAELSGFHDEAYLYTLFKRCTGMTPRTYRRVHCSSYTISQDINEGRIGLEQ